MMMMMMPLPKVGLRKGEPGEGSVGVGKAWESSGTPAGQEGFRGSSSPSRARLCKFGQAPAAGAWISPSPLAFFLLWLLDFSFSLHLQHSPDVRNRKPAVSTVSPPCCILSFGFLWKSYNIYPSPPGPTACRMVDVKKMIVYGLGTALLMVWIISGHKGDPKEPINTVCYIRKHRVKPGWIPG